MAETTAKKKVPAKKATASKSSKKSAADAKSTGRTLKPVIVKFNPLKAKKGDIIFQVVMQED